MPRLHELLARVLELDVPTVAALQGHAFAAGAMLALAHDQRVMRADRGFFCLPEVDIRIPFTRGMNALIAARLRGDAAHEAMTTGRRYGGPTRGRRDRRQAVEEERVLAQAIELAAALASRTRRRWARSSGGCTSRRSRRCATARPTRSSAPARAAASRLG